MIAVIKYKAGNLASVANALNKLRASFFLAETPEELESANAVIFPGVGHAGSAMESLKKNGIGLWLKQTQKPVLGICVGMQLLYEHSEEGSTEGLGIIPGTLKRFDDTQGKVPHMGWNTFIKKEAHPLLHNIELNHYLYYVHSYYAPVGIHTIAECNYIHPFSAAVSYKNFMGVQFHPEKSGNIGSHILQNFMDFVHNSQKKDH